MPYSIEIGADALILTVEGDDFLGHNGLSASGSYLDVVVLFRGTAQMIGTVITSYGTPDAVSNSVEDDKRDSIPIDLKGNYAGVRRRNLAASDYPANWETFYWRERTPGY